MGPVHRVDMQARPHGVRRTSCITTEGAARVVSPHLHANIRRRHDCAVGYRDRPAPRIPARIAIRPDLYERHRGRINRGFLLELPRCCLLQGLTFVHEAAWKSPAPSERIVLALYQQHLRSSRLVIDAIEAPIRQRRKQSVRVTGRGTSCTWPCLPSLGLARMQVSTVRPGRGYLYVYSPSFPIPPVCTARRS